MWLPCLSYSDKPKNKQTFTGIFTFFCFPVNHLRESIRQTKYVASWQDKYKVNCIFHFKSRSIHHFLLTKLWTEPNFCVHMNTIVVTMKKKKYTHTKTSFVWEKRTAKKSGKRKKERQPDFVLQTTETKCSCWAILDLPSFLSIASCYSLLNVHYMCHSTNAFLGPYSMALLWFSISKWHLWVRK